MIKKHVSPFLNGIGVKVQNSLKMVKKKVYTINVPLVIE